MHQLNIQRLLFIEGLQKGPSPVEQSIAGRLGWQRDIQAPMSIGRL